MAECGKMSYVISMIITMKTEVQAVRIRRVRFKRVGVARCVMNRACRCVCVIIIYVYYGLLRFLFLRGTNKILFYSTLHTLKYFCAFLK